MYSDIEILGEMIWIKDDRNTIQFGSDVSVLSLTAVDGDEVVALNKGATRCVDDAKDLKSGRTATKTSVAPWVDEACTGVERCQDIFDTTVL